MRFWGVRHFQMNPHVATDCVEWKTPWTRRNDKELPPKPPSGKPWPLSDGFGSNIVAIYPHALQGEGIRSDKLDSDKSLENSCHIRLRNPKPNMSEKLPPISRHLSLQALGPAWRILTVELRWRKCPGLSWPKLTYAVSLYHWSCQELSNLRIEAFRDLSHDVFETCWKQFGLGILNNCHVKKRILPCLRCQSERLGMSCCNRQKMEAWQRPWRAPWAQRRCFQNFQSQVLYSLYSLHLVALLSLQASGEEAPSRASLFSISPLNRIQYDPISYHILSNLKRDAMRAMLP